MHLIFVSTSMRSFPENILFQMSSIFEPLILTPSVFDFCFHIQKSSYLEWLDIINLVWIVWDGAFGNIKHAIFFKQYADSCPIIDPQSVLLANMLLRRYRRVPWYLYYFGFPFVSRILGSVTSHILCSGVLSVLVMEDGTEGT